jgi:spermidine/putrescine transport system substrate-binding protein
MDAPAPIPPPAALPFAALALLLAFAAIHAGEAHGGEAKGIVVYLYSEYIDPEIPRQFERDTGIPVELEVYETQDDMLARLQSGGLGRYDVVVATDVLVRGMIRLGLVQKLDAAAIPNAANVMERFRNPAFDPGNAYSQPYQWGTIGLLYRPAQAAGEPTWAWVFDDARQPGPFVLMDEMRSMLGIALKYQGHGGSSRKPDELEAAGDLLIKAKHSGRCLGFDGGVGGVNKVIAGEAVAAVVYNGDAMKNLPRDGSCVYAVPKEGGILWVDNLLVAAKAPNPAGANRFINYLLDAKVGAQLSSFNRYATPNRASLPLLAKDDAADPAIYPTEAALKAMESEEDVGAETRLYDEVWTAVKAR